MHLIPRLETLTNDQELLERAKLALRKMHEWDGKYNPIPSEIKESVARELSGYSVEIDNFDLNALNRERKKMNDLRVVEFLTEHGFIEPLFCAFYWMPTRVVRECPHLYE